MKLTVDQLDALKELINIGVGQAAGLLNEMIEFRIQLQIPTIQLLSFIELQRELAARFGLVQLSAVQQNFTGSFAGTVELVFPTESAAMLVAVLTGKDLQSPELDSLKISTLTEVGNILINSVMGSISNLLEQPLRYSLPTYMEEDVKHLVSLKQFKEVPTVLLVQVRFYIKELQVQGDIILFFEVGSFDALLEAIAEFS